MAGGGAGGVGNFAADPEVLEGGVGFEAVADAAGELGDGEGGGCFGGEEV